MPLRFPALPSPRLYPATVHVGGLYDPSRGTGGGGPPPPTLVSLLNSPSPGVQYQT